MEHAEIRYAGGKQFVAQNRDHAIAIDQPEAFGGGNKGPAPAELFIDSIGSCVGVYVIAYCKSVGLNTEGMALKIDWEKELKEKPYFIKKIDIKIELPKADIGPRKAALLKIAESCLIHETIRRHPEIKIELV